MTIVDINDIKKKKDFESVIDRSYYETVIDNLLAKNKFLQSIINKKIAFVNSVLGVIRSEFSQIKEIKNIYAKINSNLIEVITIVKNLSNETRSRIFSIEKELINKFVDITFNFIILLESKKISIFDYIKVL